MNLRELWHSELLWNTVGDWVLALGAFLITFLVLPLAKRYIAARHRRWVEERQSPPVAIALTALIVEGTHPVFIWGLALYFASTLLDFPPHLPHAHRIERVVDVTIVVTLWFQAGLWAMVAARFALDRRQRATGIDPTTAGSIEIVGFVVGLIVWTMAFLLALDNLGVAIKPLLAGLGIGGIAVALAVQAVLGDLLASVSIAWDKPFVIGDALQIDDLMGTVEHIGVKSTRLRSISGEQIIMSNADVLKSRLRNYGRMRERRVAFQLGVTYDTPPELLRAVASAVRRIIEPQPRVRFERCTLLSAGDSALRFEIVYFVLDPDYQLYVDTQQAVLIGILERFRALGVQFATPPLQPTPARASPAPPSQPPPSARPSG